MSVFFVSWPDRKDILDSGLDSGLDFGLDFPQSIIFANAELNVGIP